MHTRRTLLLFSLLCTFAFVSACRDDAEDNRDMNETAKVLVLETGGAYLTMSNVWTPTEGVAITKLTAAVPLGLSNDIQGREGFVAGAVLEASDASNVVVYARWRDMAALESVGAAIGAGEAPDFAAALALAATEAHPYRVDSVRGEIAIDLRDDELTMINTWTPTVGVSVDEVATALSSGIATDTAQQPGFRSTAVLASLDGSNLRADGHWDDAAALEAFGGVIMSGGAPAFASVFPLLLFYIVRPFWEGSRAGRMRGPNGSEGKGQ